jgi:hypothetical protein
VKKIIIFIAIFYISLLVPINAGEAPSDSSIHELLKLTKEESTSGDLLENFASMFEDSMQEEKSGQSLNPDQKKIIENFKSEYIQMLKDLLSYKNMEKDYMSIYKNSFTQSEVDGMISFYKTDAGRAVIEKMPIAEEKIAKIVQSKIQALTPKVQQMEKETMEKVKSARRPPAG